MSTGNTERDDFDDDVRGGVQPHRGAVILVLGILSIVMCGLLGIFAWIMGKRDLELMRNGQMDREGESLTKAGYILGIVGTILFLIGMLFAVLYILAVAFFLAAKH